MRARGGGPAFSAWAAETRNRISGQGLAEVDWQRKGNKRDGFSPEKMGTQPKDLVDTPRGSLGMRFGGHTHSKGIDGR